jgi:putative ABC transport system substrate-binding protein
MAIHIGRREFIATLCGVAVAWPVAAGAQQPMPVIGWLSPGSRETDVFRLTAFGRGLNETAHVMGRNVAIDYRWAEDHNDHLPALAADLVRQPVDVIVAAGIAAALEAKAASTTIPIVFVAGADPVTLGLMDSLSRPGGNITGVTDLTTELGPKQLELLHELVPSASRIALLVNPTNPNAETLSKGLQAAARILGLEIHVFHSSSERDFDAVFATLAELRIAGLVIGTDALFNSHSQELAKLAVRHGLPSIHTLRQFAAAGGLVSYGGGLRDAYRQVGVYTGRILKGDKLADLPVQQSTRFDLVINLKAAKALGLTVPTTLLATADEVIE